MSISFMNCRPWTLALLTASVPFAALAAGEKDVPIRYRVTVQNGTAANGLSPVFAAVLKPEGKLFTLGKPASAGIQEVAENGGTGPIEKEAARLSSFITSATAKGGPIAPGKSASIELTVSSTEVAKGATLNLVSMIGKSNDAFIAVSRLPLALIQHVPYSFVATNYDAGTEENTGNVGDFGPGGHPTAGAEGHVSFDRGLNRDGDAPEVIGWNANAALVKVERIH